MHKCYGISVHRIKAYGDVEEYLHPSLTSALETNESSTSRLCRFTLEVEAGNVNGWVAEWAPGPYRTVWRKDKSVAPP